jgi:hypothetical protein
MNPHGKLPVLDDVRFVLRKTGLRICALKGGSLMNE